jgi:hypothetical protein
MNLVRRVQDILLRPKATWQAIEAEPEDAASLYKNFVLLLALIPPLSDFIGMSVFGASAFGISLHVPMAAGLAGMAADYATALALLFVMAHIVDALAPRFGGTRSRSGALKLAAYSGIPGFLGGIFGLWPAVSIVGGVVALYGSYLFYVGLPVLMKCPPAKAGIYTVVVSLLALVAWLVVAAALSTLVPSTSGLETGLGLLGAANAPHRTTLHASLRGE